VLQAASLQFVLDQVHKRASAHKNPKVLAEALQFTSTALDAFTLGPANAKTLVAWLKVDLANTNAAVRQAAVALAATMHCALGDRLGDLLRADVKPALMATVQEQWAEGGGAAPPAATRFERKRGRATEDSAPATTVKRPTCRGKNQAGGGRGARQVAAACRTHAAVQPRAAWCCAEAHVASQVSVLARRQMRPPPGQTTCCRERT